MLTGFFASVTWMNVESPIVWGPMIKFSLSNATSLNTENIIARDLVALIDTGSDYCRIDDRIVAEHDFRVIGEARSKSVGQETIVKTYNCQVILSDDIKLQLMCGSTVLRASGASFDLILGMDAIRFFELTVNRSVPLVTLRRLEAG